MRAIRWRSRFRTGRADVDRRNRAFVDCLNRLVAAAGKREHCREMEEFLGRFAADAEGRLEERAGERDLRAEFGTRLLASLPLSPYGSASCRACGLCDLAQREVAEHLEPSAGCLFKSS